MHRVIHLEVKLEYVLAMTFDDGAHGEICLADRLFGPMFEPLKSLDSFAQGRVDEFGAVCWPNHADLPLDALYSKVAEQGLPHFLSVI